MSTCWPPYLIAQSEGQRLSAVASGDFCGMLRFQPGIYPFQRKERAGTEHAGLFWAILLRRLPATG
jgi:hypothetical protein